MPLSLKVLWSEGLALDAQHFQQLDRYHEARLQHIASVLNPYSWGVQDARWTIEGVGNTMLSAQSLTLIFRDGEIYQAPFPDALPFPIDLGKLPTEEQSFTFYAAVPLLKAHGGNLASADGKHNGTRYAMTDHETADLYTDGANVNITYMTKAVRLLSDGDVRDGYDCIPVVRVRRKTHGAFEIDPTFMAPCVSIGANPALEELLRSLIGNLTAKSESLYRLQRQPREHAVEVAGNDVASFSMLTTVMSASASLLHIAHNPYCNPERLFGTLKALAGGLMAFSRKYALSDLPVYDHEHPASGFQALHDMVLDLLDTVVHSRYLTIPLTASDAGAGYLLGKLEAVDKAALYLAINANMPAVNLIAEVPRQLKVAAPEDIESLVRNALPGLQLLHMPQVPLEVPVRPNTYHFSIENRGELYDSMRKAGTMAIYAPGTLADLKLELYAITA